MERITYKTRGMSNPQGKQKVWFCCHPDDFKTFFESISDEILRLYDCAIWYDSDPNAPIEQDVLTEALSQMTLFVMPVTTKLLTQSTRALTTEFTFAQTRHIPVLPLMQESGLETLFNEKCGNLQFLDPHQNDPTAISYDEKFKRFLGAILLGDELARRVRNAFDAYIFLSYRKKDRKYARELMRLIHKNPMYRDVAIWYDEFLTPGEDFNENIRSALDKSGLFALVVTPNLINELNYILTTEYPMARKAGKPVFPVEMVATDGQALADAYEGIPAPADGQNAPALQHALGQAILHLALNDQRGDPEHLFCIGLAYLSGIDVEVDHEKAVKLITTAAQAGLPEAAEKLVSMYNTGEGVERNYETAARWQEKLADLLEGIYRSNGSADDAVKYLKALWALGNLWYDQRQLVPAKAAYARMRDEAEIIVRETDTMQARRYPYVSYHVLGNIARAEGDLAGAREWCLKALAVCEALVKETGTVEARRDLSVSYNNLGRIAEAEGDLAGAKEWYLKVLAIGEALARETNAVESRRDLAVSYENLGNIAGAEGDLFGAKAWHLKALAICEVLVKETDTMESRRDLSVSYYNLGRIAEVEGDLAGAREWYLRVLTIDESLVRETNTVQARRSLSVSYNNLGRIAEAEGDLAGAKAWYWKALAIAEALVLETNTVEARRDLAVSYNNLGNIARAEGDLAGAKEWYWKALDVRQALVRETDAVKARRDLSVIYNNLGRIAEVEGDLAGAKEWYLRVLTIDESLVRETNTVQARRSLSVSYNNLGRIAEVEGDLAGAKEWYWKALAIAEALVLETNTVEARRDLSVSYNNLGNIARAEGDLVGAKAWYLKALAIDEALVRETDTVEARRDLAASYENLGNIAGAEGDLAGAKEWYLKARDIFEALARETGAAETFDNLAISCYNISFACKGLEAALYAKRALTIWSDLTCRCPGVSIFGQRKLLAQRRLDKLTRSNENDRT